MKLKRLLFGIIILTLSSIGLMADTTVPMKLNVSAVLSYSDGTLINSTSTENIQIGLYTSTSEFVWQKPVGVWFQNGLIEATLVGTGTNSNGDSMVLNESLFENENLKVGFVITENGEDKLALVELVSQPYAIKSASSDYAHEAGNTSALKGVAISDIEPSANSIMVYSNTTGEWVPDQLSVIEIPSNDVNEISGSFENMTVKRILGKTLTSAVRAGSVMPTGAVLMYSPDVDAPNGAFHPSSGNPDPGEVLTWDGENDVWMPSTNRLEKLTDVRVDYDNTPVNNIFKYDPTDAGGRYKLVEIGINYLKDIDTSSVQGGQFLQYDEGLSKWKGAAMNLSSLIDVNPTIDTSDQRFLYFNGSTSKWDSKPITLKGLSDIIDSNFGNEKVIVSKASGSNFEYRDFKLDALSDVDTSNKTVGSALVWKGDALGWNVEANKISDINELNGFNIASPSYKYMYHDGTEWVAKELNILTTMKDLTDTNIVNEADKQIVYYDLDTQKWRNSALTIGSPGNTGLIGDIELDWAGQGASPSKKFLVYSNDKWRNAEISVGEMNDITITNAVNGQVMVYSNGQWVNQDPKSKVSSLTDVSLTNLSDGQILEYDATDQKWVNKTASTSFSLSQITASSTDEEIDILGHLVPGLLNGPSYDLGSATNSWRNIYLSTGNVYFGADGNRASLSYDATNQELVIGRTGAGSDQVNIKMQDGYAIVGEHSGVIDTIHPMAYWDDPNVIKYTSSFVFDSANGRLGIGTTTPATALHVDGDITANKILFNNVYQNISDLPSATVNHGMFAHVHSTGKAYFSHAGNWVELMHVESSGLVKADQLFLGDGTPTTNAEVKLHVDGDAQVDGAIYISGGSDLAEGFHIVASEKVEPGTVVSIDPNNIGKLIVTNEANDTKVAGVVSGGNGIKAGLIMTQTGTLADGEYPIALTGRVWVKCTNENGTIGVGDLLTTASKPGHAMKADGGNSQGAILGKAMSPCRKDNMVLTLISLQ